jgi:hypothetical protein
MAYKIAYSPECCLLLENALDCVRPQLEEKLNAETSAMKDPSNDQLDENVDPNVQQNEDFLRAARLKKKEVQSKNLRRKKSWLDKLLKGKRKATKHVVSTQRGAKVYYIFTHNRKLFLFVNKLTSCTFIGSNRRKKMMYSHKFKWRMIAARKKTMWTMKSTMSSRVLPNSSQLLLVMVVVFMMKICSSV